MTLLIPLSENTLEELLLDFDVRLSELISNVDEVRDFFRPSLQQIIDFYRRVGCVAPWICYLAIESETTRMVGTCGFKGNPNSAGEVEISYGTVPGLEGRGHATAMVNAMIKIAARSPDVQKVIAHTLPKASASTHVLQKAGLTFCGDRIDPEDGLVWRWEMAMTPVQRG